MNQLVLSFLALLIFNLSIDVKDNTRFSLPEDLSFNDQESVIELIVEQWFGVENAFIEYDEPDQEDGGSIDFHKITLHIHQDIKVSIPILSLFLYSNRKSLYLHLNNFAKSLYLDIIAPPPKYSYIS